MLMIQAKNSEYFDMLHKSNSIILIKDIFLLSELLQLFEKIDAHVFEFFELEFMSDAVAWPIHQRVAIDYEAMLILDLKKEYASTFKNYFRFFLCRNLLFKVLLILSLLG